MKKVDFLEITKQSFLASLKAFRSTGEQFHYNQACAYSTLLERFGLDHMDIESLERQK